MTERELLIAAQHPFIVQMHAAFQSEACLHFVLDYVPGGDLQGRLIAEGALDLERCRLYTVEVSLALGFLHDRQGAIYRDLKPDNVLIDGAGHVLLADFGLSKVAETSSTFCGTAEYMAPEVIKSLPHDKTIDWWGVGVLLYELLFGSSPFAHDNHLVVQRNILKQPIAVDEACDADASALMLALLVRDPAARLGAGASGTADVLAAPFFGALDVDTVIARGYTPAWVPPADGVATRESQEFDEDGVKLEPIPLDEGELDGEEGSAECADFDDFAFTPRGAS
uniref:Protein kinase domain-containing protein n=1 Tax=Calcidiscus leptoporus TaxID=127549 RepID=A0A7S0IZQ9_9EUKA